MLLDRGYKQNEEDWGAYVEEDAPRPFIISEEDFQRVHADTLDDISETRKMLKFSYLYAPPHKEESERQWVLSMIVYWKYSLGVDDVKDIVKNMKDEGVTKSVVIYATKITACAASTLRLLKIQKKSIETFSEQEMKYNVSRHEDVPKHIICPKSKKDAILKQYSVKEEDLPQIKLSDPVCRYYGAVKGNLIKVVRPVDSMPEMMIAGQKKIFYLVSYRLVV